MIDSHCHLEKAVQSGQLNSVLSRATESGVSQMITIGTSERDWPIYRELSELHPGRIFWTAGIHPCDVDENWEQSFAILKELLPGVHPHPVGLGEMGLDYFHRPKDEETWANLRKRQKLAFAAQLELAAKLDLPVVVHSRNAFHDCVSMIDASPMDWSKVVFHCFADGPEEMGMLMERGGRASFTGILTYRSAEPIRNAARLQGPERIMIETDAPYLSPEPHRGKPNEPAYLRHTAKVAAKLMQLDEPSFHEISARNTRKFFNLPEVSSH